MELPTPPPEVARVGLRALKMVALADGAFHDLERRLLESAQTHILKTAFDLDALEPISPEELAEGLPEFFRERVLNAGVMVALIDGEASEAESELLGRYAKAFGMKSQALVDVQRLATNHLRIARVDILRRSFIGQRVRGYLAEEGIRGFASMLRFALGKTHEPTAKRYQALGELAPGTLGHGYFTFIRENGFSLPGEKDGPPEPILFHDCLHVLTGYGTSPLEETQIASFQAGMARQGPIFGMMFMLAQFQLGVQITPVAEGQKLVADPELVMRALVRGSQVERDLTGDWNPWDDFGRSITELQEAYAIPARV